MNNILKPQQSMYMPAEFTRHQNTFISWPCRKNVWGNLMHDIKLAYANVANTIAQFEPVTMIVNEQDLAEASLLCNKDVQFLIIEHDDSWIRDNGPTFVLNQEHSKKAGICWQFNAWGEKYTPFDQDQKLATTLLNSMHLETIVVDFILEGGSIHVDGEQTLLSTKQCLLNPNRNPNMTQNELELKLKQYLGISKIIWLNDGLYNDETDGHIDNVACFIAPSKIVIQSCYNKNDPNYLIYQDNLQILQNSCDAHGRKFEIIEIPEPPVALYKNERLTLSYINYYYVNDGIIMPTFASLNPDFKKFDEQAKSILQSLHPKRKVVGVDGGTIIKGGGNIHCITQQMPKINP